MGWKDLRFVVKAAVASLLVVGGIACAGGGDTQQNGSQSSPILAEATADDGGGDAGPCVPKNANITDTKTVNGTVAGSATGSDAANDHAKHYNGASKFKAAYTIVTDASGNLDKTKSTVKFTTINFTDQGTLTTGAFSTEAIPIVSVTWTADCKVKSFTFKGTTWYPASEDGADLALNQSLTGSMDLSAGKVSYAAKYTGKNSGGKYTYNVTGTIAAPDVPCPSPSTQVGRMAVPLAIGGGDGGCDAGTAPPPDTDGDLIFYPDYDHDMDP